MDVRDQVPITQEEFRAAISAFGVFLQAHYYCVSRVLKPSDVSNGISFRAVRYIDSNHQVLADLEQWLGGIRFRGIDGDCLIRKSQSGRYYAFYRFRRAEEMRSDHDDLVKLIEAFRL